MGQQYCPNSPCQILATDTRVRLILNSRFAGSYRFSRERLPWFRSTAAKLEKLPASHADGSSALIVAEGGASDFHGGRTQNVDFELRYAARSAAALVAFIATALDKLVRICGVVPYALVALGLHVITARVFFLSGQMKIAGPMIPMSLFNCDSDFSVVLPAEIRPSTFELFQTQNAWRTSTCSRS